MSGLCTLVDKWRFALRVVYVKFASIFGMFRTSEYTQLRLLLFVKSNVNIAPVFWALLSGWGDKFLSHAKERVKQVAQHL